MHRRPFLATAFAGLTTLGGCAGGAPGSSPTRTAAPDSIVASGAGAYPHEVHVDNALDREVTLTVVVDRRGTEIYREARTVAPATDAVVAGITVESLPRESRSLTVSATDASGDAASVDVSVSDCLGDVVFYFESGEGLQATYSIC